MHKAMVMAGENAANDVDEQVYGNDGAERHEAQEASAGGRRAIADADQAGQLDISGEAKTARKLRTPHVPFRDWCPICVASRGRSSPHRRVVVNKDGGHSAEIPDGLHVYSNNGSEQNSAMHHIRGNAQWSRDQLHVQKSAELLDARHVRLPVRVSHTHS